MRTISYTMKPQDVLILLKIIALDSDDWQQIPLSKSLRISQSEISQSIVRSKYAGLVDGSGKKVMRLALLDFLGCGLKYVFPQRPGPVIRGIPTAHSAAPINKLIKSEEVYVWPYAKGSARGQSVLPLYPSAVDAAIEDEKLYRLLALADALRVGKAREVEIAYSELKRIFSDGK